MPTLVVRHRVGNFDTWIAGHQDRVRIFAPASSGFKTFRDPSDPNAIAMVMEVTDMEKLGAIINDPAIAPLKAKHTVLEPITMYTEVEV